MSSREKCIEIINRFSDEQLNGILQFLESSINLAEELIDNEFCIKLYTEYLSDEDKGEPMDIRDYALSVGIEL